MSVTLLLTFVSALNTSTRLRCRVWRTRLDQVACIRDALITRDSAHPRLFREEEVRYFPATKRAISGSPVGDKHFGMAHPLIAYRSCTLIRRRYALRHGFSGCAKQVGGVLRFGDGRGGRFIRYHIPGFAPLPKIHALHASPRHPRNCRRRKVSTDPGRKRLRERAGTPTLAGEKIQCARRGRNANGEGGGGGYCGRWYVGCLEGRRGLGAGGVGREVCVQGVCEALCSVLVFCTYE